MWVPLMLAVGTTARLPWSCGPNYGCVCQHGGGFDVKKYTRAQCDVLDSLDGCIYCSKQDACNSTNPPEGLHCWPHVKECSMCASPSNLAINNMLGPGYTLYLRHKCTATSVCKEITNPIDFAPNMTINGGTGRDLVIDGMGHTLVGPCPMFVFNNVRKLTIRDLTITCNSTTLPETAPGILVSDIEQLEIHVDTLLVTGIAKSAITVLGGRFDRNVPILEADLSGSSFSNVNLTGSFFRLFMDVTLAMYYGDIDVGGLRPYTRIMIQPSIDPNTGVASPFVNASGGLIVNNFTEWTRMFGTEYELLMFDPHSTLGFTLVEASDEQHRMLRIGIGIIVGGILMIMLRFWGPVSYLYRLAKSTK